MEEEFIRKAKMKDNSERTKIRTLKSPNYDRTGIGGHN